TASLTSAGGGTRSSTSARPPASATARTVAAPSPDAPPVTRTVPISRRSSAIPSPCRRPFRGRTGQPGGGAALQVGDDDDLAAPAGQQLRLRQRRGGVVAALDPHVRADPVQHGQRGVLGEDG